MNYILCAMLAVGCAFVQPVHASETSEAIKRACALRENADHPVCVKREERRQKMRAAREAREQAQLDSILGPMKASH